MNHFLHLRLPSWGTVVDYCVNSGHAPKSSITSLFTNHLRRRGLLRQHDVLLIITPRAPSSSHSARPPAPQTCITPRRQPPLPSPPTTGSTHTNTISQVVIIITTIYLSMLTITSNHVFMAWCWQIDDNDGNYQIDKCDDDDVAWRDQW